MLQQTWPHLEIIISDDHSADGTKKILQSYEKDARFRITYQPENLGAIANFEYATNQAQGEFIAFCDQDDIWLPEKIENLYQAIGNHWLVYCDSTLIDENGQSLQQKLSGLRNMYSGNDTRGFIFSNVVWGHTMLINKQLLPHVLPIPAGIPHDIWFAFKAATLTGILYLDKPLTLYRQHTHTVTTTIATKTTARSYEKRYRDFEEKLYWITLMRDHEPGTTRQFYIDLAQLYQSKSNGRTVWGLFRLLLKHQEAIFRFVNKTRISRLIEIYKLSRGEYTR